MRLQMYRYGLGSAALIDINEPNAAVFLNTISEVINEKKQSVRSCKSSN